MSSSILTDPNTLPAAGVFSNTSSRNAAVSVRGLSKSYSIARGAVRHSTAAEAIMYRVKHPFVKVQRDTFWALDDVSFEIQKGDVVGVIGRNGAGKSTLLKILSRITMPTKGQIDLYGRVGSLLEIGTGFSAELTGRENVYLNGAILGMKRREIARQFDAIVDFAGVQQFLDTPVKRYSSGMYVRLAFAVAAHLNPEIMIVDEVLAVGDAEFQKKCLGKMKDVASEGRTVLFVSHNMDAIRNLCSRAIMLRQGRLVCNETVDKAMEMYLAEGHASKNSVWQRTTEETLSPLVVTAVATTLHGIQPRHTLDVDIELTSISEHKAAFLAIDIGGASGATVMQALPTVQPFIGSNKRNHHVCVRIDLPPMVPGHYSVGIWAGSHNTEQLDRVKDCVTFEICETPTENRSFPHSPGNGCIVPNSTVEYDPSALALT